MSKASGGTRGSGPANNARVSGGNIGNNGINAKIASAEAAIRNNNFETAIAFDDNGNKIISRVGEQHSVNLTGFPTNSIVTHNHPSGASFSKDDFITAANLNLKEIRAVGSKYTYVIKRPVSGWPSRADVRAAADYAEGKTYRTVGAFYNRAPDSRQNTAEFIHPHIQAKIFASMIGAEYTHTRNN